VTDSHLPSFSIESFRSSLPALTHHYRGLSRFFRICRSELPSIGTMRFTICCLAILFLAEGVLFTSSQDDAAVTNPSCDPQCRTGSCDVAHNCMCLQYSTSLDQGKFFGGKYCDQPAHYCGATTNLQFYCIDNDGNSTCGTMADQSPTCICHAGHTGEKCEIAGAPCGVGYCYNNATCLNGATCDCPPAWQGNGNCSLASSESNKGGDSGIKWWGGLLITGAVVAAVSVGAAFGIKKYKERTEGANRFNELKKSQMRARAESDDEYDSDPYEDEVQGQPGKKTTRGAQP